MDKMEQYIIDKEKVKKPCITLTPKARDQICLMQANEPLLSDLSLRLWVASKGCQGFEYGCGFDGKQEQDFAILLDNGIEIILDPFCAFYLQNATIDFVQDYVRNLEGFVINNHNESQFKGKFFKNEQLTPPIKAL